MASTRRRLTLLGLLLLTASCKDEAWNDSQRGEAFRLCRSQFGLSAISVFESQEDAYVRFMCQCEVDWIAERVPHRRFEDRLRLVEVNRILQAGGVYCLQRMKDRGKERRGGRLRPTRTRR
jgi:hypothetical protein